MSELSRRLFAGMWFAIAAVIPVAYYLLLNPLNENGLPIFGGSVAITAAVPICISGICGAGLGADILNPEEVKNFLEAAGRGLAIAFLSYLVMFTGTALILALTGQDFIGVLLVFAVVFFYGLLIAGWIIGLAGAAAGGLLFFYRLKQINNLWKRKSS